MNKGNGPGFRVKQYVIIGSTVLIVVLTAIVLTKLFSEQAYYISGVIQAMTELVLTVSALITLLFYSQKKDAAFFSIVANSQKYRMDITFNGVGSGLAIIKSVKTYRKSGDGSLERIDNFPVCKLFDGLDFDKDWKKVPENQPRSEKRITKRVQKEFLNITAEHDCPKTEIQFAGRTQANIDKDIVPGNESHHHLFICTFNSYDDLNLAWKRLSEIVLVIEYRSIYGVHEPQICCSHFKQDYESWKEAVGTRRSFD